MHSCLLLTLMAVFEKAQVTHSCCALLACMCACVCVHTQLVFRALPQYLAGLGTTGLAPFGIRNKNMFTFKRQFGLGGSSLFCLSNRIFPLAR